MLFDKSVLNPDTATLVSVRVRSRPRGGINPRVSRSTASLLSLSQFFFMYLLEDETASYIRNAKSPTVWPAPLFHRFQAPVIFSRYFIRFAPKPVKADYCASLKHERAGNLTIANHLDIRPINSRALARKPAAIYTFVIKGDLSVRIESSRRRK